MIYEICFGLAGIDLGPVEKSLLAVPASTEGATAFPALAPLGEPAFPLWVKTAAPALCGEPGALRSAAL